MAEDFPFPVAWRTRIGDGDFTPSLPPLPIGDELVVRGGDVLAGLSMTDGGPRWTTVLAERAASGRFLLAHDRILVTTVVRRPERLDSVLGVGAAGDVAWRTDLPGIAAPAGATIVGDELWITVTEPSDGAAAHVIDVDTGTHLRRVALPCGGDELATWSGGLLVRNQVASAGKPGLYRLGDATTAVADEPVWQLSRHNGRILVSVGHIPGSTGHVRVLAADDLRELWSAPAIVAAGALDGDHVYTVSPDGDGDVLVAHSAEDGTPVWRSRPVGRRVTTVRTHGPIVSYSYLGGRLLYRAADGSPAGELPGLLSPPVFANDRLFLAGVGEALALALPAPR
jgi:outer membrane protein assembly factor BamB